MNRKTAIEYLDSAKAGVIQSNRIKFRSILKTTIDSGTHGLLLYRKLPSSENFDFRIGSRGKTKRRKKNPAAFLKKSPKFELTS